MSGSCAELYGLQHFTFLQRCTWGASIVAHPRQHSHVAHMCVWFPEGTATGGPGLLVAAPIVHVIQLPLSTRTCAGSLEGGAGARRLQWRRGGWGCRPLAPAAWGQSARAGCHPPAPLTPCQPLHALHRPAGCTHAHWCCHAAWWMHTRLAATPKLARSSLEAAARLSCGCLRPGRSPTATTVHASCHKTASNPFQPVASNLPANDETTVSEARRTYSVPLVHQPWQPLLP